MHGTRRRVHDLHVHFIRIVSRMFDMPQCDRYAAKVPPTPPGTIPSPATGVVFYWLTCYPADRGEKFFERNRRRRFQGPWAQFRLQGDGHLVKSVLAEPITEFVHPDAVDLQYLTLPFVYLRRRILLVVDRIPHEGKVPINGLRRLGGGAPRQLLEPILVQPGRRCRPAVVGCQTAQ